MSGDNGEMKRDDLVPQDIKLTISYKSDGSVGVEGPLQNEPIVFFLLEKAKDTIKMFNLKNNEPKVVPAKGSMFNFARRLK